MTQDCVYGEDLSNPSSGHELCQAEYGSDWSWLEFHDGNPMGWKITGQWINNIGIGERGWVWINNNGGTCWQSTHGLTWIRVDGETCKASCSPGTGLEGANDQPDNGACNPYDGDTICKACRRLICVVK